MKKNFKLIAVAVVVAAATIGATYAKAKFFAQSDAWYVNAAGTCVQIVAQTGTPFAVKGLTDTQASITNADGTSTKLLTKSTCATAAKFTH